MAQITIGQLPQATIPLSGLELIPVVQNGVTKQALTGSLIALTSGVTSLIGTANQIIVSNPTGSVTLSLPQNINSGAAPVFVGTNFTNIPNSALSNSSITIGSTNIALGGTALTIAGLTSLTSNNLVANGLISGSSAVGAISLGVLSYTDTNTFASFQTSVNSYAQLVLQNTNAGAVASTDIILSNNLGTASTYYGNVGVNSSGFTGSGSYNLPNATYLSSTTGDLSIGTTTSNAIHFFVNSGTTDAMTISSAGAVTIPILSITTATITGGTINGTSVGVTTPAIGNFTTLSVSSTATLSPASANVTISPTGTGTVTISPVGALTINPTAASTINNASIGQTTPASGAFTTLSASGAVSGTGITNLFASPPAIGGTSSASGSFTTLSASSTVSGSGFSTYLASPPAIGGTSAAAGRFTTLATTGLYTPSSTIGIAGTTTNDNAQAGSWGEFPTPTNLSAVSLTTFTPTNVSSISLTAGDYEVSGVVQVTPAATTTITVLVAGTSSTSGAVGAVGTYSQLNAAFTAGAANFIIAPVQRFSLSTTTTIYLVAEVGFGTSTCTASGYMHVRRVR